MTHTVTVNDLLDGHVRLDIECLDRIYLNGYVPNLQVGGQVVLFLHRHLGYPIPSPAVFAKLGRSFRSGLATFAETNGIPVVRFGKGDRKIDVMRPHLAWQAATGRSGVAAIGVAQEFQNVFDAVEKEAPNGSRGSPSRSPTGGSPATTSNAPRGALLYPRCSWEGLEEPRPIQTISNAHERRLTCGCSRVFMALGRDRARTPGC